MTTPLRRGVLNLLVVGAMALSAMPCPAAESNGRPAEIHDPGQTAAETLQRGVNSEDKTTVLTAVEAFRICAQAEPRIAGRWYELARAEYALEALFEQKADAPAAKLWLARAVDDAQRAAAADDRLADAHTLLADLYGSKIGLEGFWAAIRFGSRADAEAKTALQLDPNNARVQMTLGRRYLYSPQMFGGDIERAVAMFRRAVELAPASDEARRWLAVALLKQGDRQQARVVLDEAMKLNPLSAATKRLRDQIP